ncbi:Hsp20/alpha crystallin family protein [Bacillus dakarensis]|uniref:Hsp20/alpha crystallin family protein n=1 Tax=Robertmurraya dakarensis TaxID=1926278 RepID=UPI0009812045|nr:Hsp20/alpha crystallin family protein [Bacillus dakarensis]
MFPWNSFPFNKDTKKMLEQMKPAEIEKYVQEMMGKMFSQQTQGSSVPPDFLKSFDNTINPSQERNHDVGLQTSVFETHHDVFVMIPIKDPNWLKEMKLFYTSNQLIIEHIPEYENKQVVTLPSIVKRKGATAHLKDQVLEVKIPKNIDMQYSEIDIKEIY